MSMLVESCPTPSYPTDDGLLDQILNGICLSLQLTKTQFSEANDSYEAVGNWLQGSTNSDLANSRVMPQGSMRLDTVVKPFGENEFDLDAVCLVAGTHSCPLKVYQIVLERLRDNGRYDPIIKENSRCIRLNYSGGFHLDVVPGISDPEREPGTSMILISDREKKIWRPSNPEGYGYWFELQTPVRVRKLAYEMEARGQVDPLVAPSNFERRLPLRRVVQLWKRWRDVRFAECKELAPSSIVLTTLAGMLYDGEATPSDAFSTILQRTVAWAAVRPIVLYNPSNPKECITDRWREKPETYDAFVEAVQELDRKFHEIRDRLGDSIFWTSQRLKELFLDAPVDAALREYGAAVKGARDDGRLLVERKTGGVTIASSAAAATGASHVSSRTSNFHGS